MAMRSASLSKANTWRVVSSLLPGLMGGCFMVAHGPIPQPPSYHDFADTRVLLGIPHASDVLTSLALVIVGLWGLGFLAQPKRSGNAFIDDRERGLFRFLFTAVLLTGFGSAWYHLDPDNYSLVWDRLPMAIGFVSIFSIMIAERVSLPIGLVLIKPLVALGMMSVLWWIWTEHNGRGDVRWYVFVQFYPVITIAFMLLLLPTRYTRGNDYWVLFFLYAFAKVVELHDRELFDFTNELVSGHSLKHLFAAAGAAWLVRMLRLRKSCTTSA